MAITINTNVSAMRAMRELDRSSRVQGKVYERLATGQANLQPALALNLLKSV